MERSSFSTSTACSVPITPATAPRIPASDQGATVPGGGAPGRGRGFGGVRLSGATAHKSPEGGGGAVERPNRRENQRPLGEIAGVVHQISRGEIIGTIGNNVVVGDDFDGVLRLEPGRIEAGRELRGAARARRRPPPPPLGAAPSPRVAPLVR